RGARRQPAALPGAGGRIAGRRARSRRPSRLERRRCVLPDLGQPQRHLRGRSPRAGGRAQVGHQQRAGNRMSQRLAALLILEGHIIDSLMLPQLLDLIMDLGGAFDIQELRVGHRKTDASFCRIEVTAPEAETLDEIVRRARELGARVPSEEPVNTAPVTQFGVYPEGFYSTSNLPTQVLIDGGWAEVEKQEMDCAIAIDRETHRAWCIPFYQA